MQKLSLSAAVVACLCFCLSANAADEAKLTCPVSGKAATKDHAAKYKEGQVYFCCDNCPKAFEANTKKYATKANVQLVSTGQYKQTKCPLSGEALNPSTAGQGRRPQRFLLLRQVQRQSTRRPRTRSKCKWSSATKRSPKPSRRAKTPRSKSANRPNGGVKETRAF